MNKKQPSLTQYIDLRERTHEEKMAIINKLLTRQMQREDALDTEYFLAGITFRFERIEESAVRIASKPRMRPSDQDRTD